jgi:hypothetical protein
MMVAAGAHSSKQASSVSLHSTKNMQNAPLSQRADHAVRPSFKLEVEAENDY